MRGFLIFLAIVATDVWAAAPKLWFRTGNTLYSHLTSDDPGRSIEYIIGVHDAYIDLQAANAVKPLVCISSDQVLTGQLGDVVKEYLRSNPATRHYSASSLVLLALRDAFPCAKTK